MFIITFTVMRERIHSIKPSHQRGHFSSRRTLNLFEETVFEWQLKLSRPLLGYRLFASLERPAEDHSGDAADGDADEDPSAEKRLRHEGIGAEGRVTEDQSSFSKYCLVHQLMLI